MNADWQVNQDRAGSTMSEAGTRPARADADAVRQRADAELARSAAGVLERSAAVPAGAVKVLVEGGWITLSGQVDWRYQKRAATDCVRHLQGVQGTRDRIAIKPLVSTSAVKAEIEATLERRATADARAISVEVQGTNVILTGTVRSLSERELAIHCALDEPGVRDVVDNLTLVG
jgi:osmotically-inducible protein OsmY